MKIKNKITALLIAFTALILASCYTPSPLYGSWSDNDGNKIQFMSDGTFSATITDSETGIVQSFEGTYEVIDNVIIFNVTGDAEFTRTTEWDMRGAILYLTWTTKGTTKNLVLYHTSR